MGKKFDKIFETVISRGEAGGYLPGDCVKFRTGYKNTETYKHMPSTLKKEVDELATCGLNIKVVQVGDKQSGFSAGNQFKPAGCAVLTIAADHGGGRTYGRVTVTTDMVDESDGVLVPDKFKKKDIVIIKPMELKVDPNLITNVTDKGNGKNTPTNLKLAGESRINKNGVLSESVPSMSITVTKAFDPLTKSSGFSAKDKQTLDSAFAFSEKDAIDKLIKRNNPSHAVVQLSNGSIRTYRDNKSRSIGESKSWESAKELGMLYESMMRGEDTITDRDRQDITQSLTQAGLDGNGRFQTVGRAINKLTEVLDDLGYSLDPVYDERIAKAHYGTQENGGFKGQNLLSFRRKNESEDPFSEEPEIENSRISFNWENLGGTGEDATFEVVAYAS